MRITFRLIQDFINFVMKYRCTWQMRTRNLISCKITFYFTLVLDQLLSSSLYAVATGLGLRVPHPTLYVPAQCLIQTVHLACDKVHSHACNPGAAGTSTWVCTWWLGGYLRPTLHPSSLTTLWVQSLWSEISYLLQFETRCQCY